MTRVAAVLAGEPRFCAEFDLFLQSLKNYTSVHWYMYFWNNSQAGGTHGFDLVAEKWLAPQYSWAVAKISENLPQGHSLARLVLADRTAVQIPQVVNQARETNVTRMWSMYHSLHQADLLRRQHEAQEGPYDLVIRARPDVGLRGTIDLGHLCEIAAQDPRVLFTPNSEVHGYGHRINDMIAIGSSASMTVYADAVNFIPDYHSSGVIFHPETMLAYHCHAQSLRVVASNFGGIVLRKLGQQQPRGPYISDFGRWA